MANRILVIQWRDAGGSSIYKPKNPSYETPMSQSVRSPRLQGALGLIALQLALAVMLTGCAAGKGQQRADGSYELDCSDQKACLQRAKRTCGDEGYIVIGGRSNKKRYGAPGNEVMVGKDEMYIRCNRDRPMDAPDPESGEWKLPKQTDPAGSDSAAPLSPTKAPAPTNRACRPGETQRCVGPGACEGGQACLMDGSAFGPCDCGTATPGPKATNAGSGDSAGAGDVGISIPAK